VSDGDVSIAPSTELTNPPDLANSNVSENGKAGEKKEQSHLLRSSVLRRKNLSEEEIMALIGLFLKHDIFQCYFTFHWFIKVIWV
jgi:hypothetical protein